MFRGERSLLFETLLGQCVVEGRSSRKRRRSRKEGGGGVVVIGISLLESGEWLLMLLRVRVCFFVALFFRQNPVAFLFLLLIQLTIV